MKNDSTPKTSAEAPSPGVGSSDLLALIRSEPDAESHIFQWEGKWEVTNEWLCGGFAGRSFVGDTPEEAAAQLAEYLTRHIGHESMVGAAVTRSGWPNLSAVKAYLLRSRQPDGDDEANTPVRQPDPNNLMTAQATIEDQNAAASTQDVRGSGLSVVDGSAISERDRAIWRAALTLAHNLCVQDSNRINDDDGSLEVVHALSDEAKRIRGWLEPSNDSLAAMFEEAGVPNHRITDAPK